MDIIINTFDGKEAGKLQLSEFIFGLEPREDILQRVVRWQLARRQQGTHQSQTRADVARTGAKMYKQKGTGRARHSSARAPQFRGGGKAHGPVSRNHIHDLPKKFRALGLRHALSVKARVKDLLIIDEFNIAEGKTKILASALTKLNIGNALFIDGADISPAFKQAALNIPNIDILSVRGANVYDILRRGKLILSRAAVEALEERFK
ncbi:50S ribosomal protein L4 [Candidatus Tokpelaia sp.]|uniref:50S ribosomal protein L4 n=1 Tax=Candidatus Tokpelaia sp. TaxID=2233777 RepID=UPI001238A1A0|nr:50S ribosomal protein L4 [Candidatus Tokpelaia sp.]KAA6404975.1 50S ribosomal protein L4 [Candidatus Tokpelaia sp.]